MRLRILALALILPAAPASAGSIDSIATGTDTATSIETIRCDSCLRKAKKQADSVVELAPGTQRIEIRDVDGVKKLYRTEAWFGGSPVVFVSKALPVQAPAAVEGKTVDGDAVATAPAPVVEQPPAAADAGMIDAKSKTSAVTADMGAETAVDMVAKPKSFDPAGLELRVN